MIREDRKVAVTGAGGFIASNLVKKLKRDGYFVRGIDLKHPEFSQTQCDEFILHDIRDKNLELFKECETVYHLAANVGGLGYLTTCESAIMSDNSKMLLNVLDSCEHNNVEKLFYSSSACVYNTDYQKDPNNVIRLSEDMVLPSNPDKMYGWERLYSELLLQQYDMDNRLKCRIARFHNVYGPEAAYTGGKENAPAAICRKISEYDDHPIEVWGNGSAVRTYLFIDDCVNGIITLTNSTYNKPLNLGSEEEINILNFYKLVAKIAEKKINLEFNIDAPTGPLGRSCDLTKTKKILNWEPEYSLLEGMKKTYPWIDAKIHRKNY